MSICGARVLAFVPAKPHHGEQNLGRLKRWPVQEALKRLDLCRLPERMQGAEQEAAKTALHLPGCKDRPPCHTCRKGSARKARAPFRPSDSRTPGHISWPKKGPGDPAKRQFARRVLGGGLQIHPPTKAKRRLRM